MLGEPADRSTDISVDLLHADETTVRRDRYSRVGRYDARRIEEGRDAYDDEVERYH